MTADPSIRIRRARAEEAGALTALAWRAKRHWGYDEAFLRAVEAEMGIAPELLERALAAFVAERGADAAVVGVYVLSNEEEGPTLRDMWVEPGAMGGGVGRALWEHMLGEARGRGIRVVRLESDPNAEGFYRRMGARKVGEVRSKLVEGRVLPVMAVDVGAGSAGAPM